jgi:hypothetical protein
VHGFKDQNGQEIIDYMIKHYDDIGTGSSPDLNDSRVGE